LGYGDGALPWAAEDENEGWLLGPQLSSWGWSGQRDGAPVFERVDALAVLRCDLADHDLVQSRELADLFLHTGGLHQSAEAGLGVGRGEDALAGWWRFRGGGLQQHGGLRVCTFEHTFVNHYEMLKAKQQVRGFERARVYLPDGDR
jgi:hypothetical protein